MARLSDPASTPATEQLRAVLAGSRELAERAFEGAVLDGALLSGVRFNRLRFSRCSFAGAYFSAADLRGCSFENCDLSRASLRGADLRGASFSDCRLDLCDLSSARLDGAQLSRVSLRAALLAGTQFGSFELLDSSGPLRWSDLSSTRLDNVDVSYAVLQGLDFQGTSLTTLRGLRDALLLDCSLQGCDLPPLLEPGPLLAERIAGGILGGGLIGGDRRLWQELPALMVRHGVDYWQRLEPSFLQLPAPLWRWPLSQLALLPSSRDYRRVLPAWEAWTLRARRSCAALKNCYLEQSNPHMASRLAFAEKELERRAMGVSLIDSLAGLVGSATVLALALLAGWLLLVRPAVALALLGVLLLLACLRRSGQVAQVLGRPRSWPDRLRHFPQWLIDLPRRRRLEQVYEALHSSAEQPSPVADLLPGAGLDVRRSRLEGWLLRLTRGRGLSPLLAVVLAPLVLLLTLLSASAQHFAAQLIASLLQLGRLLSANFWLLSCGYGERPARVVVTGLVSIVAFAWLYLHFGLPYHEAGQVQYSYRMAYSIQIEENQQFFTFLDTALDGWRHALLVSAQAFTGMGFSMLGDARYELQNALGVVECFWGLFLSAMLIWSLGRKIQAY